MNDFATSLILAAIGSGGFVGLVSLFIPKRKDRLEKADLVTDNALALAQRAHEAAEASMARADVAEKRAGRAENDVRMLRADIAQMTQINAELRLENSRLLEDLRKLLREWKHRLPGVRPPIQPEDYGKIISQ